MGRVVTVTSIVDSRMNRFSRRANQEGCAVTDDGKRTLPRSLSDPNRPRLTSSIPVFGEQSGQPYTQPSLISEHALKLFGDVVAVALASGYDCRLDEGCLSLDPSLGSSIRPTSRGERSRPRFCSTVNHISPLRYYRNRGTNE